jgi:integrase
MSAALDIGGDDVRQLLAQLIAENRELRDEVRALRSVPAADHALTVADGLALYQRARRGDKSWPKYARLLAPFVRHLGDVPCLDVTAERWGEHRALRSTEQCGRWRQIKAPSSTTLDLELVVAKMLMRWLVRAEKLPRSPLELARKVNLPNARETWLEPGDVQRLIDGAHVLLMDGHGHRDDRRVAMFRAWLLVLFGSGLRFQEALTLRRDQIGPDGVVELSAKRTKSKRRRTVALTPAALEAIRAIPALASEQHVFTGIWGKRVRIIAANTMRGWFHRVCESTGVDSKAAEGERVVPHVLRHSAASHAEAQGATASDVKELLGHASLSTTERYLHRQATARAVAVAKLMSSTEGGK